MRPGQGVALLAALGSLAKLTEVDELGRRTEAPEARKAPAGGRAKSTKQELG